jgi:dolichol-phosphate mannosyltransferase
MATLNEESGVGPTLEDINEVLGKQSVLIVDGKSDDRTVEIAKNLGANVVFQNQTGKGEAIGKGIEELGTTKYVVFIDADFTYPAGYIPHMIKILEEKPHVGMVIGNRFNPKFDYKRAMNNAFYFGNRFLAFAQNVLNGIRLSDPLSGLRAVRSDILKGWKPKSNGFDIEVEMNYHVERKGFSIEEIPIEYRKRFGEKKLKIKDGFIILTRIISESLI